MKRRLLLLLALCAACTKNQAEPDKAAEPAESHEHTDEKEHAELPTRVRLGADVIRDANIQSAAVKRQTLVTILTLAGEIVADPDRSAKVASPVSGRIDRVQFQEGGVVKKGDVLALVRVPELGRLKAEALALTSRAEAARSNARRLRELLDKRLAPEQDVINAEAEAAALENEAGGIREQLGALGGGASGSIALKAPVAGTIVQRDCVVGQTVTPEQNVASIADLSEVWFIARVFEKDLDQVTLGASAEVALNAYPSERFPGAVEYIGKQVDPVARTLTARIRVKNRDDRLRLGLFGAAKIAERQGGTERSALVVPRSSLAEVAGKKVVFVQHPDNDFELHEVVLGHEGVGEVEVLSGLREGENVVVGGVISVKGALLKSTFAEEE